MAYTINANAKNVWIRDNEDTRDLSIQTDASSVYLENGRTLEQELGEGSMVSNVATVDCAMSRVTEGTYDGAYESCVFKGKSLVNLMTGCKDEYVVRYHDPSNPKYTVANISMMKPNTEYTLFYKAKYRLEGDGAGEVGTLHIATSVEQGFIGTSQNLTTEYKQYVFKLTTTSTVDCFTFKSNGKYFAIKECVLLEGDYTNQDVPFFEGLCDVKMPILRNVGKNLLDINTLPIKVGKNICQIANGVVYSKPTVTYDPVRWIIPVEPNTTYTVSAVGSADVVLQFSNFFNTSDPSLDARISYKRSERKAVTFTTATHTSITMSLFSALVKDLSIGNIQLEKESVNTTYEDHKTNILRTSEEIVLREVNGVQDTYNALTGEYVQRIGEIVVTNTVSKSVVVLDNNIRVNIAMSSLNGSNGTTKVNNTLSDKFYWSEANAKDVEGLRVNGNTFHWCVSKNRLTSQDLQGVNTWLQSNPLTVQYELAEPVTTIVKPSTIPFAYQNGHVIVESGYEGQSLLPTLEYSTVVNRTGQVESVAKTIQKQEKQLTMLEQMLIQNIIGLDYNNTVLALNLEINEVM